MSAVKNAGQGVIFEHINTGDTDISFGDILQADIHNNNCYKLDDGLYASWGYTAMALSNAAPGEVVKFGFNGFFRYDQDEFPNVKIGWHVMSFAITASVLVDGWVYIKHPIRNGYSSTFTTRIDNYSFKFEYPTTPSVIIVWPQDQIYSNSGAHYYATPLMFDGSGHSTSLAMYNSQLVSVQARCSIDIPYNHPFGNAVITISAFQNNQNFTNIFNNTKYTYTPVTCLSLEFDNIYDYNII